jgi:hypothetical protein
MRVLVALVALAVAVVSPVDTAAASKVEAKDNKPVVSAKIKKRFGDQTVGLLIGADKVEVFRVSTDLPQKDDKTVVGFRITATGPEQDAKFAAKLASVALNEKTYAWDTAKGCSFEPGVAFRVWKGEESVVIVICFQCDQVQITTLDKTGKAGKPVYGESDPGRAALVRLAKAALPDDKDIQALMEKV